MRNYISEEEEGGRRMLRNSLDVAPLLRPHYNFLRVIQEIGLIMN